MPPGRQRSEQSDGCRNSPPGRFPTAVETRLLELSSGAPLRQEKLAAAWIMPITATPAVSRWPTPHRGGPAARQEDLGGREAPLTQNRNSSVRSASNSVQVDLASAGPSARPSGQQRPDLKLTPLILFDWLVMITARQPCTPPGSAWRARSARIQPCHAPMQHNEPTVSANRLAKQGVGWLDHGSIRTDTLRPSSGGGGSEPYDTGGGTDRT